jgi:competence protein ComFC
VTIDIDPRKITGRWRKGFALDVQTLSSTYLGQNAFGHDQYDTKRSGIGELLYRLKYRGDAGAVSPIVDTVVKFLTKRPPSFDLIIPVPASATRSLPPVMTVAKAVGSAINIPVIECVTTTRPSAQLKDVSDPEERKKLMNGLYAVDATHTQGKRILLFDDLYRSGTTMNAITEILYASGGAADVLALTLTCTRSNR